MRTLLGLLILMWAWIEGPAVAQAVEPRVAADREVRDGASRDPDLANGAELYETCAACHGPDGRGTDDGEIPAIAGQHRSVLLKQITDFRHEQRSNERMRNFTDRHHLSGAQDLADVSAFVAQLPRFSPSAKGIGDGKNLDEGTSVYFRSCERCHGPLGQGDELLKRPRLAGQHYAYLLRQLQEGAARQRPGMGRMHVDLLEQISPEQMSGVSDYLSRVSPGPSSPKP